MRTTACLALLVAIGAIACGGRDEPPPTPATTTTPKPVPSAASPATPTTVAQPPAGAAARVPRRDPLVGGPYPALLVSQAQFAEQDGKTVPGPAKLMIVRKAAGGWTASVLEDPDSNVFHKAVPTADGILTIGGNQALLRTWRFADGTWSAATHWNPTFGGRFNRLRDIEQGDVDGDGKPEWVIATHDQGVVAVVHPDEAWRVQEIDRQPNTFVHEVEIGDVDGDKVAEFFTTPSHPNKLDQEQPGEVHMYRRDGDGWKRSVVDAPGDTHAKEILAADVDADGVAELYVAWEGTIGAGGALVRPVTIKQYRMRAGAWTPVVVATIQDRQMRAMQAGDVDGDGSVDLVAGALKSGLWIVRQGPGGWAASPIDVASSGYEHPVDLADLDDDGALEIYVASEDQAELRQYRWQDGRFAKTALAPLVKGDITWNVGHGRL
jgi:hypothetical protein